MSWDVELEAVIDGHPVTLVESVNYTHNCNGMIRDAGFAEWPYEIDGMLSDVFTRKLGSAIYNLKADPRRYQAMNPENGWGSYETLLPVLERILVEFDRFPSGRVRCWA